jgi:hypothetical protein
MIGKEKDCVRESTDRELEIFGWKDRTAEIGRSSGELRSRSNGAQPPLLRINVGRCSSGPLYK